MICTVVGARPNFMKMAPIILEARRRGMPQLFVHTGQHYDAAMSAIFSVELGMPTPDVYLGVGSGSHAEQTARVMIEFERVCMQHDLELVVVGGDVNSTLACALSAAKLGVSVAHVEAGLRSFDRSMPEEINRVLTDHLSDFLFTSEKSGTENLALEGIAATKVHFVGNCMIDSLRTHLDAAQAREPWRRFGVEPGSYALLTLHRPGAVDEGETLDDMRRALQEVGQRIPILFPTHPRTRKRIEQTGQDWAPVSVIDPLGYLDFLGLMSKARLVLTDSGGIQEETTALGVPCLTLRPNTERPITVEIGTNRIVGTRGSAIVAAANDALDMPHADAQLPPFWDGHAALRIVSVIQDWLSSREPSDARLART